MPEYQNGIYQLNSKELRVVNFFGEMLDVLENEAGITDPEIFNPGWGADLLSLLQVESAITLDSQLIYSIRPKTLEISYDQWQVAKGLNVDLRFNALFTALDGRLEGIETVGDHRILHIELPGYKLRKLTLLQQRLTADKFPNLEEFQEPGKQNLLLLRAGENIGVELFKKKVIPEIYLPDAMILDRPLVYLHSIDAMRRINRLYHRYEPTNTPPNWGFGGGNPTIYWRAS